jgi:hypothetical protein
MTHRNALISIIVPVFVATSACVVEDLDQDELRAFGLEDGELEDGELEDEELDDVDAFAIELDAAAAAAGVDCQCAVGATKQEWGPNCERLTLTCFTAPCHPTLGNTGMWVLTKIDDIPCPPTPYPLD